MALAGRRAGAIRTAAAAAAAPSLARSRTSSIGRTTRSLGLTTTRASAADANNSNSNKKKAPAAAAAASASASASAPPAVADAPAAAAAPPPFLLRPEGGGNSGGAAAGAAYDGPVFIDRDGVAIRVMPWDYGFRSGAARTGGVIGAAGPSPLLSLRAPTPVASAASSPLASRDEDSSGGDIFGGSNNGNAAAAALNAAQQQQQQPSGVAGKVPANLGAVARANFRAELFALRASFRRDEYRGVSDAARPTAGPLRRLAAAAGGAAVGALAAADRALEGAGVLPRLDLGPRTTVGAGATSAAMASSASSDADECAVDDGAAAAGAAARACEEAAAAAAAADAPWRRALAALDELTLDDASVAARDPARAKSRPAGSDLAPWPVRLPFAALCLLLDALYAGRPLQRFWVLETVARVPYFAYISVLHLYESVGLWRAGAELRRVHFAEEYNELHHLQIMESLGGDRLWVDRFVAEHSAVFYYWLLVALYALAPRSAYRFSELVEVHAYDSYDRFAFENAEKLKALPPPLVAARYYRSSETLYMFDGFQDACGSSERRAAEAMLLAGAEGCGGASAKEGGRSTLTVGLGEPGEGAAGSAGGGAGGGPRPPRRPPCDTLYDVFINIRDDEAEHVVTMKACADDAVPNL